MTTIHLHHLENSRSFRILWLLEELGMNYQLTTYERDKGLAPKSLQQVHPMGKAPILQDADKTLIESANIIEYLIDHYDNNRGAKTAELISQMVINNQFRPDYGTPEYEQYRYWLHFVEGSLMPLLVIRLLMGTVIKNSPIGVKQVASMINKGIESSYVGKSIDKELEMLDKHLGNHEWLAGTQFTGADIHLEFAINAMAVTKSLNRKYANIHNWLKKCQARPAYAKAVEKGGKVTF